MYIHNVLYYRSSVNIRPWIVVLWRNFDAESCRLVRHDKKALFSSWNVLDNRVELMLYTVCCMNIEKKTLNCLCYNTGQRHMEARKAVRPIPHIILPGYGPVVSISDCVWLRCCLFVCVCCSCRSEESPKSSVQQSSHGERGMVQARPAQPAHHLQRGHAPEDP